ncbi:MAG: hypothetical protein WBB65_03345 [Anaerolineales bacterium]
MNPLVEAFGPVFIAGFALQQLIDLLDPILDRFLKTQKAWLLSMISFVVGLILAVILGLRVLRPFGVTRVPWLDVLITALLITGGTKWLNDLLKIIKYRKLELRARARAMDVNVSAGGEG